MFSSETYTQRRTQLGKSVNSGIVILPGNGYVPMNYPSNHYPFRQDSTFLYYFGLDQPGLNGIIDLDEDGAILFGDELTMDDVVWTGPQPTLADQAKQVGVFDVRPSSAFAEVLEAAEITGRDVHFLPPYHLSTSIELAKIFGFRIEEAKSHASEALIRAVVAQRLVKSPEEVKHIEEAVNITAEMHLAAMRVARPGLKESDVYAALIKVLNEANTLISFPPIVTINGQVLHNHSHHNELASGRLLLVDCGAENRLHYAGDMTRTFPVDRTFTQKQREMYEICLQAQIDGVNALKPGVPYRDIHLLSCKTIVEGLKSLGLMKGNTEEAVAAGAHALFFPHGLGHAMGLDVHDMENVGENFVGYDKEFKRSEQFGLAFLRFGRRLAPGHVMTVEPGIYFIPELMDQWKKENTCAEFINYQALDSYRNFGGIRIEEDLLITDTGFRLLGKPLAKTVAEIEAVRAL